MSLIDILMPVAAAYFAAHTALVGPLEVEPVPKRIYGNVANYDGDTLQLKLRDGFAPLVFMVRVLELDTPEMKGACPAERAKAEQAKRFTSDFLTRGPIFLTKVDMNLDRYGRVLASIGVQFPGGVKDLADGLKSDSRGIARGYEVTEGRQSWCDTP